MRPNPTHFLVWTWFWTQNQTILHFTNKLCYGYLRFEPKVAIVGFFRKMQRKTWYSILGVDAMALTLKNLLLRVGFITGFTEFKFSLLKCVTCSLTAWTLLGCKETDFFWNEMGSILKCIKRQIEQVLGHYVLWQCCKCWAIFKMLQWTL